MDNGVLRIHPLDGSNDFEHFSSFWALNVHDNHHGGIRHIKTSFDDKYVFTAGLDGNFFVFRFMDEAVKGLKVPHKVSIPSAKVRSLSRGWIFNHLSLLRLIDNPGLVYTTPGKCEHTTLLLRLCLPFTLIRVDGASDKEISKMVLEKLRWRFSLRKWHCLTKIKRSSLFETSWFSLKHLFLFWSFLEIDRRGGRRDRKENWWYWWSKPLQYWTWKTESRARSNGQTCRGEKAGSYLCSCCFWSLARSRVRGTALTLVLSRANGQVL